MGFWRLKRYFWLNGRKNDLRHPLLPKYAQFFLFWVFAEVVIAVWPRGCPVMPKLRNLQLKDRACNHVPVASSLNCLFSASCLTQTEAFTVVDIALWMWKEGWPHLAVMWYGLVLLKERNSREAGCCKGCSLCCHPFVEANGVEITTPRVALSPLLQYNVCHLQIWTVSDINGQCDMLTSHTLSSKLNEEALCKGAPSDYRSDSTCATVATGKSLSITCCFVSSLRTWKARPTEHKYKPAKWLTQQLLKSRLACAHQKNIWKSRLCCSHSQPERCKPQYVVRDVKRMSGSNVSVWGKAGRAT